MLKFLRQNLHLCGMLLLLGFTCLLLAGLMFGAGLVGVSAITKTYTLILLLVGGVGCVVMPFIAMWDGYVITMNAYRNLRIQQSIGSTSINTEDIDDIDGDGRGDDTLRRQGIVQ